MNESMDRALTDWLRDGPDHGSREALERALAATRRTSQRPGWTFPERWLPMQLTMQRAPALRPAMILALVGLLIAALAAALVLGSQRRLPDPFGPAGNGLVAYDAGDRVYIAQSDGTKATPIEGGLGHDMSPAFSRDGTMIAFWSFASYAHPDGELFVADADGRSPARPIAKGIINRGRLDVHPAWSPDGGLLYFNGSTADSPDRNMLLSARTDGTGFTTVVASHLPHPGTVVLSPDGGWLAFREDVGDDAVLTIIRPDGTDKRHLVSGPANSDTMMSISWSADSQLLTLHRNGKVETVDIDDRTVATVSRPNETGSYPTWSPDGTRIAYASNEGQPNQQFVVANADGTGHRDLGSVAGCTMGWSPDSAYLFGFTDDCFSRRLTRVPVDDPSAAVVFDLPGKTAGFASWQRVAR